MTGYPDGTILRVVFEGVVEGQYLNVGTNPKRCPVFLPNIENLATVTVLAPPRPPEPPVGSIAVFRRSDDETVIYYRDDTYWRLGGSKGAGIGVWAAMTTNWTLIAVHEPEGT